MSDIASNRRALHDYHILARYEAGIELKGTEVKSIRGGLATLNGAFARVENAEVWLYGADIQPYIRASAEQHEPKRQRRLLLNKAEINKLFQATTVGGHSIVALRMYWKGHHVKVEIGVGQGKQAHDKRTDIKQKTESREADREVSRFNRKHG
jgi:SsrA-binding protein